jgi:hypothetical protein
MYWIESRLSEGQSANRGSGYQIGVNGWFKEFRTKKTALSGGF